MCVSSFNAILWWGFMQLTTHTSVDLQRCSSLHVDKIEFEILMIVQFLPDSLVIWEISFKLWDEIRILYYCRPLKFFWFAEIARILIDCGIQCEILKVVQFGPKVWWCGRILLCCAARSEDFSCVWSFSFKIYKVKRSVKTSVLSLWNTRSLGFMKCKK